MPGYIADCPYCRGSEISPHEPHCLYYQGELQSIMEVKMNTFTIYYMDGGYEDVQAEECRTVGNCHCFFVNGEQVHAVPVRLVRKIV